MDFKIISDIVLFAISLVSFIYGYKCFIKQKTALYARMVTLGIGCFSLGKLYNIIQFICSFETERFFNIGHIGTIGCFMFFLTANSGQFDSLVDDRSRKFIKYRVIATVAPLIMIGLSLPAFLSDNPLNDKIVVLLFCLVISQSSYYHLKHIVIPDVENGVVGSISTYNAVALTLSFATSVNYTALFYENRVFYIISSTVSAVCIAAIVPVFKRGMSKWTQ